jgi:steroid delta-isomerase-like uncharacterized protein
MSEENKTIVERFIKKVWSSGNMEALDEIFATDFVYHDPAAPDVHNLEAYKQFVAWIRTSFPDMHYTIEDIVAEADRVVVRYIFRGTHTKGEMYGVSPTGKQLTHAGISIYRFAGGKAAELWDIWDALGALQQLGAIPSVE